MPIRLLREILVTPLSTQCDFVPSDLRLALFWLGSLPTQEKCLLLPCQCAVYPGLYSAKRIYAKNYL